MMPPQTAAGPALGPVEPPVALFPQLIATMPTTLVLQEKIWSGDDFAVADANTRQPVIWCKGSGLSTRKYLSDAGGRPLMMLREKTFSSRPTFIAEDVDEREIFRIRHHFSWGSTTMTATFRNTITGQEVELNLEGDMFGVGSVITLSSGQPVAQITREFDVRDFFGGQTYFVTVAPGVDLALVTGICIAFDEAKNDRRRR